MNFFTYGSAFYLVIKAIHIIFMVSYFAGIFYLVRLFVYDKDAEIKSKTEKQILKNQYLFMMRRLWNIIIIPAGIIMLVTGLAMLCSTDFFLLKQPWIHIKLTLLLGLVVYHFYCWKKIKLLKKNNNNATSIQLRMINEIATIFLFLIVFVAILKTQIFDIWKELFIGFLVLFAIIFAIVKLVNQKK